MIREKESIRPFPLRHQDIPFPPNPKTLTATGGRTYGRTFATILAKGAKVFIDFQLQQVHKLPNSAHKEDSFEPTKKNNANEVSGECLVRVSFERLYHLCAD